MKYKAFSIIQCTLIRFYRIAKGAAWMKQSP
nr:MAG TPA: hypothetical protein [Caudoviricetes sp.]